MTTRPKLVWDSGWSFANNSGTRTPILSVPYSVLHFTLESHNVQNLWFFVWCNQILWQSITFSLIEDHLFIVCPLSLVMAPLTSNEMHEKMVIWWSKQHKTAAEIAGLASCFESTVYDVLRLHREYGQVTNLYAHPSRPHILQMADIEYIHSLWLANPALYLDELQEQLLSVRDVDVSLSTISHTIWGLALTHKHISKTAAERNELLRATWQAEYGDIPAKYFVWLDQSGVDDKTNQHTDGWAPLGHACVQHATFIRGQRYSVLPALSADGIIALDIFKGIRNISCTSSMKIWQVVYFQSHRATPWLNIHTGSSTLTIFWCM